MAKSSSSVPQTSQAIAARSLIGQFKAARRCGTPLVAIQTPDPLATVRRIVNEVNGKSHWVAWDCVKGLFPLNQDSQAAVAKFPSPDELILLQVVCKLAATMLEKNSVLFLYNAQRHMDDPAQVQSICNLRDEFKLNGRTLVLVGPHIRLPAELQHDVVTLDEPLPTGEQLATIVRGVHKDANAECPPEKVMMAVEAIQGLPAFAAEQVTAMSLYQTAEKTIELDVDGLWEKKRRQIEQTPGLSVSREGIKFSDLGGLEVVKDYLRDILKGESKPQSVVFIDEIEKMIAGQGDTSGVSQDHLQGLLTYMQDHRCPGILMVGHPGSGKSATAKATGNEAGVPTIQLDLGAAKGSLVGQSEQQLRTALKVITAVSNGQSLWIATCNSLASLPPELRRRFKLGIFFFDLPTKEERESIWKVQRARFNIAANDKLPQDEGWTGAEIESCCELAWRLGKSLVHAANFVVPISQSAPERVAMLREQADCKWLSASKLGVYRKDRDAVAVAVPTEGGRKIEFGGEE